MNYTIDMEHWQRKTIYLGRKVYEDSSDASIWQQLYIADLFYDGKNAARKAKLRIRMKQFADHFTAERPGSIFDVFASIGGFASIVLSVLTIVKGLVDVISERLFSGRVDQAAEAGFAVTAATAAIGALGALADIKGR